MLDIAKPLTIFHNNLESYTKQTNRLSPLSKKIRQAFVLSQSPADLLFTHLPNACGFPFFNPVDTTKNETADFTTVLGIALSELLDIYATMINKFLETLATSLFPEISPQIELSELRTRVKSKYEYLATKTVDVEGLRSFIQHLADAESTDDIWLQRLLFFLGKRPPQKWTDNEQKEVIQKLTKFSKRLIDLNAQHRHLNDQFDDDSDLIRLQIMRLGHADLQTTVPITKATHKYIAPCKKKVNSMLEKIEDDDMRLYILTSLVEDCLNEVELEANG